MHRQIDTHRPRRLRITLSVVRNIRERLGLAANDGSAQFAWLMPRERLRPRASAIAQNERYCKFGVVAQDRLVRLMIPTALIVAKSRLAAQPCIAILF